MHIQQINNNNLNFNGKIKTKGKWNPCMERFFRENPEIQRMAEGRRDIIGIMHCKPPTALEKKYLIQGERYKLTIMSTPENPSFLDKIKMKFGLMPKVNVSKNYHSSVTTIDYMESRIKADEYKEALKLD